MPSTKHIVINALLFQLCWYSAIFVGALAASAVLAMLVLHHWLSRGNESCYAKLAAVAIVGILFDSMLTLMGGYYFAQPDLVTVIPGWLIVLWLAFSLTLDRSLRWAVNLGWLFVPLCAVAGSLSYLAGRLAGVIAFENGMALVTALVWTIVGVLCWVLFPAKNSNRTTSGVGDASSS